MSINTARIRPAELLLPAEGGCWIDQDDCANVAPQQASSSEDQLSVHRLQLANLPLNSSCSDLATPLTPTFSHHGGNHLRYASSTSSLDLQQSFSSTCSDSPVSPAQQPPPQIVAPPTAPSTSAPPSIKRLLPDVQEDPLEREDNDYDHGSITKLADDQLDGLYDCLCMT